MYNKKTIDLLLEHSRNLSMGSGFSTVVLAFLNVGAEGIGHDKDQVSPDL